MSKYILSPESSVTRARVDDKLVTLGGEGIDLTKDQVSRLEEMDGVELEAASSTGGDSS